MCGIVGLLTSGHALPVGHINAMAAAIAHRGPDGAGFAAFIPGLPVASAARAEELPAGRVLLAHSRLAIIDTGEGGHQPMTSDDGSHVIVFNGEIYNYVELRDELVGLGWSFRTHSDTEVLLKAWMQWGDAVLPRLVGMFAFAILDCTARRLVLARDPFGIKPLYWTRTAEAFAFASEIKALLTLPGVDRTAAPQALFDYLRLGYTDRGEGTLLAGIHRLPPAHWAIIDLDNPAVEPRRYWRINLSHRLDIGFDEAAAEMRRLFLESVRLHLRADVPVGSALSGGIDSSAVVMAMRQLQGPSLDIHAFSYVANDKTLSEETWIDRVAAAAGATVHKVRLTPAELVGDLDAMIAAQDEPFGGTSILAQYNVYRLARQTGIKVTMDGQGADEMLGGYPVYIAARAASIAKAGRPLEALSFLRRACARCGYPARAALLRAGRWLLPQALQEPARRLVGESLVPGWLNGRWFAERGAVADERLPQPHGDVLRSALLDTFAERSLPALLRYGDRNSMAHSVESRVPFLTPQLAEFAFALPEHCLIAKDGTSKAVFRAAMRGIVPDAVLERRDKIGFATPQHDWLNAMAPWVESLLNSDTAHAIPAVNATVINATWSSVQKAGRPMPNYLWRWLNMVCWCQQNAICF